ELLVELLGAPADAGFPDLSQPLGAMAGIVDVPARTGNRPAAIQRFQAIHDSRQIFDDGQVAPGEFSQHQHGRLAMVDRLETIEAYQSPDQAGIVTVTFAP